MPVFYSLILTILGKSRTYTSLFLKPGLPPPMNTAFWWVILVREKLEQGGGLGPVEETLCHFAKTLYIYIYIIISAFSQLIS